MQDRHVNDKKNESAIFTRTKTMFSGQMFDYNPWIIVPLVGPSASLMKSGCTVTTAIALDRILAFYFPVQYYQLSKRR